MNFCRTVLNAEIIAPATDAGPDATHGSTREDLFSVVENGDVAREVHGNHLLIDQVIDQG